MIRGYKEGMEYFQRNEYAQAIDCFESGTCFGESSKCLLMLGKCYENGLGVSVDLSIAKDYYKVALIHFEAWYSNDCKEISWLNAKIREMNNIPDINEQRKFIDNVGLVIVKRGKVKEWSIKFNEEGTLVSIGPSLPFCRGFIVADSHTKRENPSWTCDEQTRFYDGYMLDTDFFSLRIKRGRTSSFVSSINGRNCIVEFPGDADLNYLYVQENIMNNVRALLKKRAEAVFPQKLKEISERVGVPFSKCKVVPKLSKAWAYYCSSTQEVAFSLSAIQLPEENFEALCIHELTHSFTGGHDGAFWNKFRELAGQHIYDLDCTHHRHGKWASLKI